MTKKQKRFVEEYLIDLNATQAAIRAGYKAESARQLANENLTKPYISAAIDRAMAERSKRTGINQDRVIQELARIAFVKITDVIDENGEIRRDANVDDLATVEAVKIKEVENQWGTGREREVRLASKLKALELLGKHLGMFKDKLDVGVDGELKITVDYGDGEGSELNG